MTTISATTILRSRHAKRPDKVLSTLVCKYPRWIHAEGKTHRQIYIGDGVEILLPNPAPMDDENMSRNAGSSRAIPVQKMIQAIREDPAVPLFWGKNIGGMQAREELPPHLQQKAFGIWMRSMESAIAYAEEMIWLDNEDPDSQHIGAHKQIINRMLEPYMHIVALYSATEWSNFLALRVHADAEPHIQLLAQAVRAELDRDDNIQDLEPGSWHLPFVTDDDAVDLVTSRNMPDALKVAIKKSVACCASTSYKTVDGFDMTIDKAIELHDKLVGSAPLHASPAEHVAQADGVMDIGFAGLTDWTNQSEHGNFVGFRQYRKMLPNECL